jgi:hypothetical protein
MSLLDKPAITHVPPHKGNTTMVRLRKIISVQSVAASKSVAACLIFAAAFSGTASASTYSFGAEIAPQGQAQALWECQFDASDTLPDNLEDLLSGFNCTWSVVLRLAG